ncbi:MAG TPA: hypothetical protein VFM10_02500, partial [Terriglobales bacterium]|nr:hypothetical protein [Terriglobales bacterium]
MATSARKKYIHFASPPFEEEIFSGPQLVSAEDEAIAAPVPESPGHSWFGAISEALNSKRQRRIRISHLLTDLSFVLVNAYVGFCLVTLYGPGQRTLPELLHPVHERTSGIAFLMLYAALIALCCQNYGLYRARRTRSEMQEKIAVCKAVLLATFLFICFLWLSGNKPVSRLLIAFACVLNVVSFVLWRTWTRQSLDRRVATGKTGRNVAILGATAVGLRLAHTLQRTRGLGYVVRGFVDDNHPSNGVRVLGTVDQLHDVLRGEFIDEIFITPPFDPGLVTRVAAEAAINHVEVKLVPEFWGTVSKPAPLDYVGEFPVFALHREPIPEFALFVKRTLDVLASGIALFMLSPLFLAIAAAVRIDSPGPAFYSALR